MSVRLTKDLRTGVPLVDNQHKEYIRRLNIFLDKCVDHDADDGFFHEQLEFITRYAVEHFEAEDALMDFYKYPIARNHIASHGRFREAARDFCMTAPFGVDRMALVNLLVSWLVEHIKKEDAEMAAHVKARQKEKKKRGHGV